MLYVTDEGQHFDITSEQAEKLVNLGLIVKQEDTPNGYDTTAFVWDDLGITGVSAILLLTWALDHYKEV